MKNNSKRTSKGNNSKRHYMNYALFFLLGLVISGTAFGIYYMIGYKPQASLQNIQSNINSNTQSLSANAESSAQFRVIDTKTVPIVAVDTSDNKGIVGNITVKLIPGTSQILAETNPFLEPDLQYSINVAVGVAKDKTSSINDTDFIMSYSMPSATVISGGSAGAATTIAVLAALEHKDINKDVIMTGTIQPDGTIGYIGGLLEKAQAAADAGYKVMLIPKGQMMVTYYEKMAVQRQIGGITVSRTKYVPKTENLADALNGSIQIKEVSNIDDAEKYFFS